MSTTHSMEQFKRFIRNHPSLVKEVRRGIYTWQDVYEDWYLLGEENTVWDGYRETASTIEQDYETSRVDEQEQEKDMVSSLFESLKSMDLKSMQKHVSTLSQALGTISGVISQFQGSDSSKEVEVKQEKLQNPFDHRKD